MIAGSGSDIGDAFVSHPIPKLISFTGSTEVGHHIGEVAGKHLKDVSLELGGNNVMIVLKDADIEQAVLYRGYALVDILQPCVSFNKVNTYSDYARRVYPLPGHFDNTDKMAAMKAAMEFDDKIPTEVFYGAERPTFHDRQEVLTGKIFLASRPFDPAVIRTLIVEFV